MRESRLYINFFRRNFLIILLPLLFSLSLGFYYSSQIPKSIIAGQLYEMPYRAENINIQVILTDEAVSLARESEGILGLGKEFEVRAYKTGPLSFYVSLKSAETAEELKENFIKVDQLLIKKFGLNKEGQLQLSIEEPNLYKLIFLFGGFGLTSGIVSALAREYFHKF